MPNFVDVLPQWLSKRMARHTIQATDDLLIESCPAGEALGPGPKDRADSQPLLNLQQDGRGQGGGLTESQSALFEADKAALADDEVVQHFDVHQLARLDEHLGQAHIFG